MEPRPEFIKKLTGIGLTEKAALVYAAVLELGVAFPSKVAEMTKLNRTTVYHILTDLSVKGLITEIERKKKLCYQVEPAKRLINFTKTQVRLAEKRDARAKKLLPDIEGLLRLTPNKPRVRYFEGIDGIRAIYEDHIAEQQPYEMLVISNLEALISLLPESFVRHYVRTKQKRGITTRAIIPNTTFGKTYRKKFYRGVTKKFLPIFKTIPAEQFPYHSEFKIYGTTKVSITNFQKEKLIGVIIEEKTIADMMRIIFELAWKGAAQKKGTAR